MYESIKFLNHKILRMLTVCMKFDFDGKCYFYEL